MVLLMKDRMSSQVDQSIAFKHCLLDRRRNGSLLNQREIDDYQLILGFSDELEFHRCFDCLRALKGL